MLRGAERSLDALMGAYQGAVPGAGVAVLRNGAPPLFRAYGLENVEDGVAATTATNYRLASLSKQFTAAAILLLVEEGRLSLDDRVCAWLPSLPHAASGVRIHHLLTHTSGIADYEALLPLEPVLPEGPLRQLHDTDVLRLLETHNHSYFAPGMAFRYSNSGYVLLALVAVLASGVRFATLLRERIFKPLHMDHTLAFEAGVSSVAHRAFGYSAAGPSWLRTDQSPTSATLGDGGIYSSIDDMAKWDAALYDSRLLSRESLRLAFTPATPTPDPQVHYGFGWRVTRDMVWHSGESLGFRNVIVRYPGSGVTVIVLTNRDDPEPYPTALAIAELYSRGSRA